MKKEEYIKLAKTIIQTDDRLFWMLFGMSLLFIVLMFALGLVVGKHYGIGFVFSMGVIFGGPVLCARISGKVLDYRRKKWGLTGDEIAELERRVGNGGVLGTKWEKRLSEIQNSWLLEEKGRAKKLEEKERAKKYEIQKEEADRMYPLIQQLCKLNVGARKEQEAFLTERYSEEAIPFIFETEYSEEQKQIVYLYWRRQDLQERRKMVELLFKLTVLEDGIRNNEWNLLIQIMTQLKFNNYYIDYFKKRYAPLRTEFDEYQRSSTSSANYSASYLKPYYSVLGLQEGATDEEIKRAYHELAMQHHPDRPHNAGCIKECEAMMAKLNEAYEKVMG